MANPRQRRKARSSTHKAVSHSLRAKKKLKKMPPIRGPKVLQEAWDNHKTVHQNYAALGLVHTLNPSASGGVETRDEPSVAAAVIPKGYGKIVRDEEGNVVRVETEEVEGSIEKKWASSGKGGNGRVVKALERIAESSTHTVRHSSKGQVGYLSKLVGKYGSDVELMARDRRLNWEQRTAGELRRGLKRMVAQP